MAEKNYTLSYISEQKKCSIEDFCKYAEEKGILIPNNPDYLLSPSKLNAIDPMLAFNLKYERGTSGKKVCTDEDQKEKVSIIPSEVSQMSSVTDSQIKVLREINLSALNQSTRPNKKINKNKEKDTNENKIEKKQKAQKKVIGIVKFFDSTKGWGFIVSSNKGISGKPEDEGKLFSLHITQ